MTDPIIKIKNLSYSYPSGKGHALSNISCEIQRGEYVAIMGANGAGKTTFCLHLNGVIPLMQGGTMEGTVEVAGLEPYDHHVYDMAEHVGMVLQDPETQIFSSDVVSEVAFGAENQGVSRPEMIKRIEWALDVVRMTGYESRPPSDLSGGQKQRLVIAANLVTRPEVLVLDEPTSQLDPVGTSEVFSILQKLNKELGMTIMIATHAIDQVAEFADRIMVLENGRLIAFDKPRSVFYQVGRMHEALLNVPDVAELDIDVRKWISSENKLDNLLTNGEANVTVDQVKASLEKHIQNGYIKPAATFQRGLGRFVSDSLSSDEQKEALPVLEVENISYGYTKNAPPVISNISFSIQPGEIVAMIGQNGAGKTTLMKCITGLYKPLTGKVKIAGKDVSEQDGLARAKEVGLILQNPDNQLFQMSSREEIAFGLKNLGLPDDEVERRIADTLALTGLEEYIDIYPFKLSLGDRRKLCVASIYAMHPRILIFDEPTTGQDYTGRYQLCDLAMRLNKMGATIIMITHDMTLVSKYTQRTLVMGKGTLLLDAPTREVFSYDDVLQSTFLESPPVVQLTKDLKSYNLPQDVLTMEELYHVLTGELLTK